VDHTYVIAAIAAIPSVLAAFLVYRTSTQANRTGESRSELDWVKELRQDALDTRKEMEAAQEQVKQLRRQLETVTREADHWIAEYQFMQRNVWRDGMSVERLRELLGPIQEERTHG
jgi:uncharacterized protein YlxW (UPF0749 family)